MASPGNKPTQTPFYPQVNTSNPDANSPFLSQPPASFLYPSLSDPQSPVPIPIQGDDDDDDDYNDKTSPTATDSSEELLLRIPNSIVHLIDKTQSMELASGDLEIVRLLQSGAVVAVFARIGDQIQWPLAKDEPAVKLDDSHYFFSLRVPEGEVEVSGPAETMLNYGLTIHCEGQEGGRKAGLSEELDRVLGEYSSFSVERVSGEAERWWRKEEAAREGVSDDVAAAFWTTVAPNVEDYSSGVARMIASGSGKVVQGILWCGDVTVERLRWGNDFLRRRISKREVSEVSPEAMLRIQRVRSVTRRCEEVANGVLSGVVKVTGYITSSIVNSKAGRKFFSLLPGEIILASLDGFNKVCDAVETAGKNVLSTSSTVTTELVSERYGEHAARATNEGFGAAGHALGTAWAVFKIRKAINPKSVVKPTALAKAKAQAPKGQGSSNPEAEVGTKKQA